LERSHRRLPPIVTKYEFIQVHLELVATDTVMSPEQPLLEIASGSVRQRHCGLRKVQAAAETQASRGSLKAVLQRELHDTWVVQRLAERPEPGTAGGNDLFRNSSR
jgi:hypothetical protein